MDKNEIAVLLLSSAVIGAVSSALITALAQWRERVARERELLFTTAVDLSKTYMQRISVHSKAIGTLPELVILAGMHNILKEVFKKGRVSKENLEAMTRATEKL